ncbi:MAG: hypothetical protein AB1324_07655 [Candidatus Micrarchaeota archaeon]
MKKLDFGMRNSEVPSPVADSRLSRREILGMGLKGAAVLAVAGCGGAALLAPRKAYAQGRTIGGVNFEDYTLPDTLANLDRRTSESGYRSGEARNDGNVIYSNVLSVPQEFGSSVVFYREEADVRRQIGLTPRRAGARARAFEINDFVGAIRQELSRDVTRVKLILEESRAEGELVKTVYAVPVDDQGRMYARYNNGYLATCISYFTQSRTIGAGHFILYDPSRG